MDGAASPTSLVSADAIPPVLARFLADPLIESLKYGDLRESATVDFGPGGRYEQEYRRLILPALDCEFCEADHKEILRAFREVVEWRARELLAASRGDYDVGLVARDHRLPQAEQRLGRALRNSRRRIVLVPIELLSVVSGCVDSRGKLLERPGLAADLDTLHSAGILPGSQIVQVDGMAFSARLLRPTSGATYGKELTLRLPFESLQDDAAMARDTCLDAESSPKYVRQATFVFLVVAVAGFAIAVSADHTTAHTRPDGFHPRWTGLLQRHFSGVERSFTVPACINASIAAGMNGDEETGRARQALKSTGPCEFHVPYVATWSAVCAGCVGVAGVCWWSGRVLRRSRGSPGMSDAALRLELFTGVYFRRVVAALLCFVVVFWLVLNFAIDSGATDKAGNSWRPEASFSFVFGVVACALTGHMATRAVSEASCRTAAACWLHGRLSGTGFGVRVAFRSGVASGLAASSLALLGAGLSYACFANAGAIAAYSFGASLAATLGRTGAGICASAARAAAHTCGDMKPATENGRRTAHAVRQAMRVSHSPLSGMLGVASDLLDSSTGCTAAAAILGGTEFGSDGVAMPLYMGCIGVAATMVCGSFVVVPRRRRENEELEHRVTRAIQQNSDLGRALVFCGTVALSLSLFSSAAEDTTLGVDIPQLKPGIKLLLCCVAGLLLGWCAGSLTGFFTRPRNPPARSVARATSAGLSAALLRGIGCAMHSSTALLAAVALAAVFAHVMAGWYGVAISGVAVLTILPVAMGARACGPIGDTAVYCTEECKDKPAWVQDCATLVADVGDHFVAQGRGLASATAALSALTLSAAFGQEAEVSTTDLLSPLVAGGVFFGALFPCALAGMVIIGTSSAARDAAQALLAQVKLADEGDGEPHSATDEGRMEEAAHAVGVDSDQLDAACAEVMKRASDAALRELALPTATAIFVPVAVGLLLGSTFLYAALMGAVCSNLLLGAQMSNAGSAWLSVLRWIESGGFRALQPRRDAAAKLHLHRGQVLDETIVMGPGSNCHAVAVQTDQTGAVLREAAGPALSTLVKLTACWSLVIARVFDSRWGQWWIGLIFVPILGAVYLGVNRLRAWHHAAQPDSESVRLFNLRAACAQPCARPAAQQLGQDEEMVLVRSQSGAGGSGALSEQREATMPADQ
eukprot:TRINITY_DN39686_c0_g1_i1.p1 TRINITY_DN39686_c0_g1~~TRINITY_DN39686_c0_g1_i1.p1  ORF type:complete len:1156 (+),score=233.10 TRINITY_DN39686_c0_g1_i1:49-3516(+)